MNKWFSVVLASLMLASGNAIAAETQQLDDLDTADQAIEQSSDADILLAQYLPTLSIDERTVSVIGNGSATAAPDYAQVQMYFSLNNPTYYPDYSVEAPVSPQATIRRSDLQPIVDAITALGIPESDIEVFVGSTPPIGYVDYYTSPRIQVRVNQPTHSDIQEVIDAANGAITPDSAFYVSQTGSLYGIEDCSDLEAEARREAITNAQEKAQSLAASADLELGEIVAVSGGDVYPGIYGSYGCPTSSYTYIDPYMSAPPYNPFSPLEIQVTGSVTMVYEIAN